MHRGLSNSSKRTSTGLIGGRYQVLRTLGVSRTCRAELVSDRALEGEKLVLKIIHRHLLQGDEDIHALRRAILAARQLSHANIARIFDFECLEGQDFYFTSEYVDGESLRTALDEKGSSFIPFETAMDTLLQLARGLAHAHGKAVYHLDLRPENVIVGKQGELKISDFGIARSLERDRGSTRTGEFVGEMMYMAPEQLAGGAISACTDVYSFGILAFELLTGAVPFQAKSQLQLVENHLRSPLPELRALRPELPIWCEGFVRECTGKAAVERLANGAAVLERLEKFSSSHVSKHANTYVVYFRRRLRRKSWFVRIAVAAGYTMIVLLGLLTLLQRQERMGAVVLILRSEAALDVELGWMKAWLGVNGSLNEPDSLANAVRNKDCDSVDALLRAGADPNKPTRDGSRIVDILMAEGSSLCISEFLDHKVDFNLRDKDGNTPILYALKHKNYRWIATIARSGADVQTPDHMGVTPLIYAAKQNAYYWVSFLVSGGRLNPSAQDALGKSALHYAVEIGDLKLVTLLLGAGSSPNVWDRGGRTPLMLAAGKPEITKALLAFGPQTRARDNEGASALHLAAKVGDLLSVKQLLGKRAFSGSRDDYDKRPIDYASEGGFAELADILREDMAQHPLPPSSSIRRMP